jgi:hypothetical protein
MRTVFEPSNALEGYMLQDLLKQRGITARLDGAQLQGGVGELPVTGFVRLVVDDDDYDSARTVIDEWESTAVGQPTPEQPARMSLGFLWALLGLVVGIGATYAILRVPSSTEGIDHDGDGVLDERWEYSPSGAIMKSTLDRNFDGKADFIYSYDAYGHAELGEADDDFNGVFETRMPISKGTVRYVEIDTDGDSQFDLRTSFRSGVPVSVEHRVAGLEAPVRVEYYRLGKLVAAEADTDRNGYLDTRYEYSPSVEIISTERLQEAY